MASVSDGELIRRALQEIVDSTLASPLAVSARETALKLLQWSLEPANHQEFFLLQKNSSAPFKRVQKSWRMQSGHWQHVERGCGVGFMH